MYTDRGIKLQLELPVEAVKLSSTCRWVWQDCSASGSVAMHPGAWLLSVCVFMRTHAAPLSTLLLFRYILTKVWKNGKNESERFFR